MSAPLPPGRVRDGSPAEVERAIYAAFFRHDGKCPHCGYRYERVGWWARHVRQVHGEDPQ